MRVSKRARWALVIVATAALVLAAAAAARTHSASAKKPIVIGWAHDDSQGPMGPFDLPALAAAQIEKAKLNKKGGVLGHKFVIKTCDTQKDDATASKACADQLISQGAKIIFTTCDVNLAAPVVQEAIKSHLLTVAPCIGTDQLGPKFAFCGGTKLCFSFGNVAQDEGSAMAEVAWQHGWKTADLAKDTAIIYFRAVINAFKARFTQLGGKINYETTYLDHQFGGNNVQNAVTGINAHKSAVVVTATAGAWQSLAPLITGMRTAGNKAPVLNSWAGDGTYWLPTSGPKITNYWFVTYANAFGHDPSKAVNKLAKSVNAATGGFITGPAAMDGVALAIKRAHGSLSGAKLAAIMQKFHKVPTISGKVSFSTRLHSVFGRAYRVIEINNNKPIEKGTITAKKVPNSPDQP